MSSGDDPTQNKTVETAQNVVAYLIAGFGAILGFLGFRASEVSDVIRNHENLAATVGLLLLVGLICAVAVVALPKRRNTRFEFLLAEFAGVLVLSIAGFALIARSINVGGRPLTQTTLLVLTVIVSGIALVLIVVGIRYRFTDPSVVAGRSSTKRLGHFVPLSFVLLIFALVFVSMATYTALRLESVSQQTSVAEIATSLTMQGQSQSVVKMTISAARILEQDYVYVRVFGLPRSVPLGSCSSQVPHPSGQATCLEAPCSYLDSCDLIGAWKTGSDFNGTIDRTIAFPVSSETYQRVHIEAEICGPVSPEIRVSEATRVRSRTGTTTTTVSPPSPDATGAGCVPDTPTFEDIELPPQTSDVPPTTMTLPRTD